MHYFKDIEEPGAEKVLSSGEEFEYTFATQGPGGFISCDVYRPGKKDDPLYIQVIGSDKNVTRYIFVLLARFKRIIT